MQPQHMYRIGRVSNIKLLGLVGGLKPVVEAPSSSAVVHKILLEISWDWYFLIFLIFLGGSNEY